MAAEMKVPELGENVEKGDVVRVLVNEGDTIAVDQPIFELETDKATIEVPSTVAGKIVKLLVKQGEKVKPGQVVLAVEGGDAAKPQAAEAPAAKEPEAPKAKEAEAPAAKPAEEPKAKAEVESRVVDFPKPSAAPEPSPAGTVPAAPSVRRFARELGVDIAQVKGSGPGGRIGSEDVKAHVKAAMVSGPSTGAQARGTFVPLPDFSKFGSVESKPMSNIRRKTAEHLTQAWMAPAVTQNDKADLSGFEAFREAYGKRVEKAGGKLTITAVIIKILAAAIDKYPQFASSVDMANTAIIYKGYRHIGVAVDTPNGLLVPVIRDVNTKSITDIAIELASVSQKARDKKLSLDDMSGGVMSVTNLGGIGGTSFSPIVNQPEVAILGLSRTAIEPVWNGTEFVPKPMLPLSLSYDHRVIDGADAARFLRFIVDALESPLTMVL